MGLSDEGLHPKWVQVLVMRRVLLDGRADAVPGLPDVLERRIRWTTDDLCAELTSGLDAGLVALLDGAYD